MLELLPTAFLSLCMQQIFLVFFCAIFLVKVGRLYRFGSADVLRLRRI